MQSQDRPNRERSRTEQTRHPGVFKVHSRDCRWRGGRCNCEPTWQAAVRDGTGRQRRKNWPTQAEARSWAEDVRRAVRAGTYTAPSPVTVGEALDAYLAGMEDGTILDRSGRRYKPATVRSYRRGAARVAGLVGRRKLGELRRRDVQDVVDRLRASGLAPSTVRNALDPLRACYRRALRRDDVSVDPTAGLELPSGERSRDRIADEAEAVALLAALPEGERPLWATALYTSLRRGELQELRWSDVDLAGGTIRVERAYDDEGRRVVEVKSDAGRRTVPLVPSLVRLLAGHALATGRRGEGLVFGRTAADPFVPSTVRRRALAAWGWKDAPNPDRDGPATVLVKARPDALRPIALHECRHTTASLLLAAGVPLAVASKIIGHASVSITGDRYGHLLPGAVAEAGELLAARLERV